MKLSNNTATSVELPVSFFFPLLISLECYNISTSLTKYHLENLTPGAKYNISLAGVTGVGEGLQASITINTLPEKPVNGNRLTAST